MSRCPPVSEPEQETRSVTGRPQDGFYRHSWWCGGCQTYSKQPTYSPFVIKSFCNKNDRKSLPHFSESRRHVLPWRFLTWWWIIMNNISAIHVMMNIDHWKNTGTMCVEGLAIRRPSQYKDIARIVNPTGQIRRFLRGIHRWPVKSSHKGPVTRKMFAFDDVIMEWWFRSQSGMVFPFWSWIKIRSMA